MFITPSPPTQLLQQEDQRHSHVKRSSSVGLFCYIEGQWVIGRTFNDIIIKILREEFKSKNIGCQIDLE